MSEKRLYGPDDKPLGSESDQGQVPLKISRDQEASLAAAVAERLSRSNRFRWGVGWRVFLLIFAIVSFALGWGVWSAIDFMRSAITNQFKEPRIQQTVEAVASNQASNLMVYQLSPEVARFRAIITNDIRSLRGELQEASTSVIQIGENLDLAKKILAAYCDDRLAFDYLVHWRGLTNKDPQMISSAIDEILSRLSFSGAQMPPGMQVTWDTNIFDPDTATWEDYLKFLNPGQVHVQPRFVRGAFLEKLSRQTRFSREAKLELYFNVMCSTPSLDMLNAVCTVVNNESKTNYNILGVPYHLKWLNAELRPLIISNRTDVLRHNPDDAQAYFDRGGAYYSSRDFERGLADIRNAVRLSPKEGAYHNGLAWYLATCPTGSLRSGKEAIDHALKACELPQGTNANTFGTLAAAYAEAGKFEKAIQVQQQSISMEGPSFTEREERNRRLALYQKHQPTHEMPKDD